MACDWFCRDCMASGRAESEPARCPTCGSPRLRSHPELFGLSIAHVDCDAFYASVEKRDDPSLRDKPLIIGGGQGGIILVTRHGDALFSFTPPGMYRGESSPGGARVAIYGDEA